MLIDHTLDAMAPADQAHVLDTMCREHAPWTLLVLTQDPDVLRRLDRRCRLVDGQLVPMDRVQEVSA